jgi:hypothetical protein
VTAVQPTIVTGRRRQHELLRSWSGWPLTSILIDPSEVTQVLEAGWAGIHHRAPETGERIVGTADGPDRAPYRPRGRPRAPGFRPEERIDWIHDVDLEHLLEPQDRRR